jgi:hypothetical protein
MPLDDREQSILDEIERQFYKEDPELVEAVRRIHLVGSRRNLRLSVVGLVLGVVIVLVTFSINTWFALAGFMLMVGSATGLVQSYRSRGQPTGEPRGLRIPFRRFRFRR